MLASYSLAPGVRAAFTDRYGGVSESPCAELNLGAGAGAGDSPVAVRENRRRVAQRLGLRLDDVAWMRQVHSGQAAYVQAAVGEEPPTADALVTATIGLALAVVVADCVPVLIADPAAGVVGVAHAGRPGFAAGVVAALLKTAADSGARPDRSVAMIGPAICGQCYEVPEEMQQQVGAVAPATRCRTRTGTAGLDLPGGVESQLREAGVADVRRDPRCTRESAELYSYRRDGRTGRFAGYVWLSP